MKEEGHVLAEIQSSRNLFFNRVQILFSQIHRTTELCEKKPEKFDPGIYNSIHYPV